MNDIRKAPLSRTKYFALMHGRQKQLRRTAPSQPYVHLKPYSQDFILAIAAEASKAAADDVFVFFARQAV